MQSGARICPRCGTRVDERRARTSPVCLTCGAQLGAMTGAQRARGGRSPLIWVGLGVGALFLLGTCGVAVVVVALSSSSEPKGPTFGPLATSDPALETATPINPRAPTPVPRPNPAPPPPPTFIASPRPSVTPTPVASAGPFPRARATAEVDRVNSQVQTCRRAGDPTGTGSVRIDFEPDGRTTVTLRPPFGTTPTGSCISSRFAAIRIGKFDGPREGIERTFRIDPT